MKRTFFKGLLFAAVALLSACATIPMEDAPDIPPRRPFGSHQTPYAAGSILPNHISPKGLDAAAAGFYDNWKNLYLAAGCGEKRYYIRVANVNGHLPSGAMAPGTLTISEAHGYGMMIFALMAGHDPQARRYFDGMYRFFRDHSSNGNSRLMGWNQVEGCRNAYDGGGNSATDADLDIAYALLLADGQWGSDGPIDYRAEAGNVMAAILADETNRADHYLLLGDYVERRHKHYRHIRTSDLMTGHFRAFTQAGRSREWQTLLDSSYAMIADLQRRYSPAAGLLPDFAYYDGQTAALLSEREGASGADHFDYNACRVPWRLAVDHLTSGDARAKTALEPMNHFIRKAAENDPQRIVNGYTLSGEPDGKWFATAFAGPFIAAAMVDKENQDWLNAGWDALVNRPIEKEGYYGNTLKLLSMITISGNWWKP